MSKQAICFGIIVFPGTNCEHDCRYVLEKLLGVQSRFVWHKEQDLEGLDALILPGGFSYGDYLRSGAVAKFSPIMSAVRTFAAKGGTVLGICNGFQILLEENLLPGAMLKNNTCRFLCRYTGLVVENHETCFSSFYQKGQVLHMPIRHNEGNYYIDAEGYQSMVQNNQIIFRYGAEDGTVSEKSNPNGSIGNIAGICNEGKNILGMMPHPESCCEKILGSDDGLALFCAIIDAIKQR